MKKYIAMLSTGLAVAFLMNASVQANATELLANAGFESAIEQDTSPDTTWGGFTGYGVFPLLDTTAPNSGASHLALTMGGVDGSFQGVQQAENGIIEGEDYTFSIMARTADETDFGLNAEFRIEWLDAMGAFVGGQFDNNVGIGGSVNDTYQTFSQTHTAPAGATTLRAVIAVQTFGAPGTNGSLFIDDASLTGPKAIPEPTAAGLVALAMTGVVARRRR